MNSIEKYNLIHDTINDLNIDAFTILQAFTDFHGMQLLTDEFMEHLRNEGILYDKEWWDAE